MKRFLFAILVALTPQLVQAMPCGDVYIVSQGDSLSEISARAFGTQDKITAIHDANLDIIGPDPTRLQIGQELYIPCPEAVTTGDNLPLVWNVHLDPARLATLAKTRDIQIVDIRPAAALERGVIPGAIHVPYKAWRGPAENPGAPPSASELSSVIGSAGLRLDRPIVLIHDKPRAFDTGRAAFVYWLLKSAGAEKIALLHGGHSAWVNAGLPIANTPVEPTPFEGQVTYDRSWWATREDVRKIADGTEPGALLDARPSAIFRRVGDLGNILPSTLPFAFNTPATDTFKVAGPSDDGVLELISRLKDSRVNWEAEPVVSFCDTGELAALNWFYASEVSGIRNVKLYPESTRGWQQSGFALAPAFGDL